MKKLATIICILFINFSYAQTNVHIQGKLQNMKDTTNKVYLKYMQDGKEIIADADVVNNSYSFNVNVMQPTKAEISSDNFKPLSIPVSFMNDKEKMKEFMELKLSRQSGVFFLEPGNIMLESEHLLLNTIVKGSPINDEYKKFTTASSIENSTAYAPLLSNYNELNNNGSKAAANELWSQKMLPMIKKHRVHTCSTYIVNNPSSLIAITVLESIVFDKKNAPIIDSLFNLLPVSMRQSKEGQLLKQNSDNLLNRGIGLPAKEFNQKDTSGKLISLSSFRGKYVLLDFWASWCGPCRGENPNLIKAFQEYNDKGFMILSVSLDELGGKEDWLNAIKKDGIGGWTHVSDLRGWKNEAAQLYKITETGLPFNLLIDPDGIIIDLRLLGPALDMKLNEIYGK